MGSVCIPSYCTGEKNPGVTKFFNAFKAKYHVALTSSYSARGYDLASALVAAIKTAGSTDGPAIAKALFSGKPIQTLSGKVSFTAKCHRPQPASHVVEQYTNGKAKVIERYFVKKIPDIGDGSSCSGAVPQVK
jgi:branched-chain amino acid transport system substrate-binding protein